MEGVFREIEAESALEESELARDRFLPLLSSALALSEVTALWAVAAAAAVAAPGRLLLDVCLKISVSDGSLRFSRTRSALEWDEVRKAAAEVLGMLRGWNLGEATAVDPLVDKAAAAVADPDDDDGVGDDPLAPDVSMSYPGNTPWARRDA